jgi:hypothetical protein
MEATTAVQEGMAAQEEAFALEDELATLAAHVNAATCRWLELVAAFLGKGTLVEGDAARWLAFRCGLPLREARECLRVAEALEDLPAIQEAFARGQLTFAKVRALTRVATAASEEGLLELAFALSASQLERALRAYRRIAAEEARETHELEYVDYHWGEDGSLYLRARLAAEDGTLVVKALEAARERLRERRHEERRATEGASEGTGAGVEHGPSAEQAARAFEATRSPSVEALVELARSAVTSPDESAAGHARLVVHVDARALEADGAGRSELEHGPVVSCETARRLGCDAETVAQVERDGISLSVGRARRSVPPRLRRALEARDDGSCRWPGCENRRHLDAHHRTHWARGGETSLENLVLLCWHHHRLVHEGGYTIEDDPAGGLRFRNRHGALCPGVSRPPPGSAEALVQENARRGLAIDDQTLRAGGCDPLDLGLAVAAIEHVCAVEDSLAA